MKKGDPSLQKGKIKKGFIPGADMADPNERGMTKEQKEAYRAGKRREGRREQTTINIRTRETTQPLPRKRIQKAFHLFRIEFVRLNSHSK